MSLTRLGRRAVAAGVLGAVSWSPHPRPGPPRHVTSAAWPRSWPPTATGSTATGGDFDILDKAVHTVLAAKPRSAVAVLADGSVRLTAFLPTDRAFRGLVTDLTGHRRGTERGGAPRP